MSIRVVSMLHHVTITGFVADAAGETDEIVAEAMSSCEIVPIVAFHLVHAPTAMPLKWIQDLGADNLLLLALPIPCLMPFRVNGFLAYEIGHDYLLSSAP